MTTNQKELDAITAQLPEDCTFSATTLLNAATPLIDQAVREDAPSLYEVDAKLIIEANRTSQAKIVARENGVFAGGWLCAQIAKRYDENLNVEVNLRDGTKIKPGDTLVTISGLTISIVISERIILNFLARLGGVATLTNKFVTKCKGTKAALTDTRKTLPAYRILDKYAVQAGDGTNHRINLCDGVMIKDNHIAAMTGVNSITEMVKHVRAALKATDRSIPIWVEVDRLDQLPEAFAGEPDVILLDNMPPEIIVSAINLRNEYFKNSNGKSDRPMPLLEASGGIALNNIASIAKTGVDRISVGVITHSAPALDLSMEINSEK